MSTRRVSRVHCRRALALIVVVYVLAALGTFAFALAYRGRAGLYQAQLSMHRVQQDQMALAACEQACRLLVLDDPNVDSCDDAWSGWRALERQSASGSDAVSGQAWWRLVDESSKINVNVMSADVLSKLPGLDAATVASIVDWIDEDDAANPDGAESEYYAGLFPAYSCRNAPMECLEELTLIKGITAEIYFGARQTETPEDLSDLALEQVDDADDEGGSVGLCDLLTVYGDGKINLNTALSGVLRALPFLSETGIEEILSKQKPGAKKFTTLKDIESNSTFSEVDKIVLRQIGEFASSHFQLQIKCQLGESPSICEYAAILERDEATVRVLSWQRRLPRDSNDQEDVDTTSQTAQLMD